MLFAVHDWESHPEVVGAANVDGENSGFVYTCPFAFVNANKIRSFTGFLGRSRYGNLIYLSSPLLTLPN